MLRRTFNKIVSILTTVPIFDFSTKKNYSLELLSDKDFDLIENLLKNRLKVSNSNLNDKYHCVYIRNVNINNIKCKKMDYIWRVIFAIEQSINRYSPTRKLIGFKIERLYNNTGIAVFFDREKYKINL